MIFLRSQFLEVSGFTLGPFLTPAGWHEEKYVYWKVSVGLKCMRMVVESLAHSPLPADLSQQCRMSDVGCRMPDAGCQMPDAGCRMPDAGCRMPDAGCRMSDVGCRILTRQMSDF